MIGKKKKLLAVDVLLMAVLIAADQITKFFAVVNLKDLASLGVVGGGI